VLDALVLELMEKETLSRKAVLKVFEPVQKRAIRGTYTGYGKRVPSDRPPVLTQKEMALTAASDKDGNVLGSGANGQSSSGAVLPGTGPDDPPGSEDR
jgi:cell division protease FtsH